MIRLPNIPAIQQSNPSPVAPSAGAVAAPARALQDVSRGLATVGDSLQNEALRIQQIENARRESEIRQGWQASMADLNARLATETDPTKIPELTQNLIAELHGTVEDESLPPVLRDRLASQYADFSTNATIRAGEQASRLAIRRAEHAFKNETQAAIRTHDRPGLEAAIDTASDAFGLLPEQADAIRNDFERTAELDLIDLAVTELPDQLLEYDNDEFRRVYPHLDRHDLRRAQSAARSQIQQYRAEEIDTLTTALDAGELTEEQIQSAERLTARDKQQLTKALVRTNPLDLTKHPEAWDILFQLRNDYQDPAITDAQYAAKWNDARIETMALLPDGYQGDIRQELSYRSPANRKGGAAEDPAANLPTAKEFNSIARERLRHAQREELVSFNQYQNISAALTRWIKENPTASWDQMREWLDGQIGVAVEDGPAPIIPSMPPATPGISEGRLLRAMGANEKYPLLPAIDDLPAIDE